MTLPYVMAKLDPDVFLRFDPTTGVMPRYFTATFTFATVNAREILASRNAEQIRYAYESILYMQRLREIGDLGVMEDLREGETVWEWATPGLDLRFCVGRVDIGGQPQFPDAQWPEYFAILALSFVGKATNILAAPTESIDPVAVEVGRYVTIGDAAIDATEAITIADMLRREIRVVPGAAQDAARVLLSESKHQAAIKGYRQTPAGLIRQRAMEEYDSVLAVNSVISNRAAAYLVWSRIESEAGLLNVLQGDSPENQIQKWIASHRKSKGLSSSPDLRGQKAPSRK